MQTVMFYMLLVSGFLNILNFREERFFFSSRPSNTLLLAICLDILVATDLIKLVLYRWTSARV